MIDDILKRIEERLVALNLTAATASRKAGLSKDAIRNMKRASASQSQQGVSTNTINALAAALEVSPAWLLSGADDAEPEQDRTLPVFGLAAGSLAGQAVMTPEPVEFVPCPPALTRVRDAYALTVTGTSMEPRYFAGDLIFIHPHRPVRPGDHVVVQVRKDPSQAGVNETWIKRFKADTETEIVTEQYNPRADMRFKRQYVAAIHRVLTVNELLGV